MGVGKTSFGKKIANKLKLPFIDTDELIEQNEGKSINAIFEDSGEEHFRNLEKAMIEHIFQNKQENGLVLSVGGGLPVYNNMIDRLNELGDTVYLQRPAKELFNRLVNAKSKRPLVKKLSESELLDYIEKTLKHREDYYSKAKVVLNREDQKVDLLLERLKH